MAKLVKFNIDWDDKDFYKVNPHVKLFPQFSGMTSDEGWAVYLYAEPDEDINPLYRLPPAERKEAILSRYPDLDWDRVLSYASSYELYSLSSIQRSYKEMLDTISQRTEFLKATAYDIDNARTLDSLHLNTSKIFDQYSEVYEKFIEEKESARVKGGRKLSKAERGEI